MTPPPEICGYKPVPMNRLDRRWVIAKDQRYGLIVDPPGRFGKVQDIVHQRVHYVQEPVDSWASPQETWDRGQGDCEDFALLKRAILLSSGIPDDDLFFVMAWDAARRQQHAFLVARQGDKSWLMDVPGGMKTIYPVADAKDFRPYSAFTGNAVWAYA